MTTQQDQDETRQQTVTYVYGIVPADVEADPEARGVGESGSGLEVVRYGDIAALVSQIDADRPLGNPEDLTAHAQVLDGAAGEAPVLPLRFGAALTGTEAVTEELLQPHHDEFAAALRELEGKAQYVVKGRYVEEAVLSEILSENDEAAELRESIRGKPEDATRDERIALGELVNNAIVAKREADTQAMVDVLESIGAEVNVREPTHEEEAVQVACLAEVARQGDLEDAVAEVAHRWEERVELRVLGPLAPYDFVTTGEPQE
jgi:Gas vesicle synthesis protein GvpL/GvpF